MMVATPEAALPSPYLRLSFMMGVGTVCAVQGRPGTSARLAHDTGHRSAMVVGCGLPKHARWGGKPSKTESGSKTTFNSIEQCSIELNSFVNECRLS